MTCPIPTSRGRDCWGERHPSGKFGICIEHWEEIARAVDPEWSAGMNHQRCMECGRLKVSRRALPGEVLPCDNPECSTYVPDDSPAAPAPTLRRNAPRSVVYYVRFGDRVKIGTSTNLPSRLKSIYHDELVAVEPGNASLEHQRHKEFSADLIPGQREWFTLTPRLAMHMANVVSRHGAPRKVAA